MHFPTLQQRRWFYPFLFLGTATVGCGTKTTPDAGTGPVGPASALATFELEPGFKIELVAAEPLVADPVDMEIDEYGRLYVVEMPGYPLDKSGSGKIKLLADTNGDGQMDQSTVFAEGLVLPNGIMRWKKGVLVTDAPNVLYLEDTDADGRADIKDTVLTGFSLSNPHINVNNPVYGLDNWIYLAHRGAITTRNYQQEFGDEGTEVYFPGQPGQPRLPKNAGDHCVRFRPDQRALEMTSGKAQFGQTFDTWGHHLLADNQNHAFQPVIAAAYLARNPELLIGDAQQSLSDHGNVSEVFQITKNPERQLFSGAGVMTSASGVTAYGGGAFPPPFDQQVTFVCESVSNLVHADRLQDAGATFVSSRVGRPRKEFLASTDAWFRPVNTYVGPDGALYVVDYYRQIIEHPEWMSEEAIQAGGLYNGKDQGRIYRISATDAKPADWTNGLRLGEATPGQLVEKLASPNSWWRTHAQRLLVDRADPAVVPALVRMARHPTSPVGRLHALWTLEGLGELQPALIRQALGDSTAGIRENALRLAELHLPASPELVNALLPLEKDADAKVRFQLLCTLGSVRSPAAALVRNQLLFADINDKWVQVAALSAASSQTAALLTEVLNHFRPEVPAYASLVERLTAMVGASGERADILKLIQRATTRGPGRPPAWQAPVLAGLAQGMQTRPSPASVVEKPARLVATCFDHPSGEVRQASLQLLKVIGLPDEFPAKTGIARAVSVADNRRLSDDRRAEAVHFLALGDPAPYASLLKKLIIPQEHPSIQLAALKTLSLVPDQTVTEYVLQAWLALTPGIRDAALNTFMANPERKKALLDAIESGKIPSASLGWSRSAQLMGESDDKLRNRARALLNKNDDEKINQAYQQALTLQGDGRRGKVVFQQNCAVCHQVRGTAGTAFGPDLGTVQNWLAKDIMANVLAPNLSVAVGFDLWSVELKNGEALQGIIASETSAAITLRIGPGAEKVLNRQDVQSLKVLNASAMPVLTSQINQQQMADLLAFLRQTN
ncbi:MAG: c-type cytochrome [Ferruginibacter sp.]|nr:c-type cytochrome [Cytophagales bacterium]